MPQQIVGVQVMVAACIVAVLLVQVADMLVYFKVLFHRVMQY
jgi:hypothetical protein